MDVIEIADILAKMQKEAKILEEIFSEFEFKKFEEPVKEESANTVVDFTEAVCAKVMAEAPQKVPFGN